MHFSFLWFLKDLTLTCAMPVTLISLLVLKADFGSF